MEKFFKRLIQHRRSKRSLVGTIAMLIVVIFLMSYLLKIAQAG
ncbi:MAG: hypothetical protein U9N31_04640 [Candidatus Marinimicrobia bacterium]|nr:hypothetical protein [Candidatus Neomarinimicrobiota bacterium]